MTTQPVSSLDDLIRRLEDDLARSKRQGRRRLWVLGFLVVFAAGYLSWLHRGIREVDAQGVTDIATVYAIERLPELEDTIRSSMIASAPDFGRQVAELVARAPQLIREELEVALPPTATELARTFEEPVGELFDTTIDTMALDAPLTIEELIEGTRVAYREALEEAMERDYEGYVEQARSLRDELDGLARNDQPTPRERLKIEIIQATLELMDRYKVSEGPLDLTLISD